MGTDDDPIVCPKCIPYEKILQNENIIITSNKFGGHLSSHSSFFSSYQFLVEPPLEFFGFFKDQTDSVESTSISQMDDRPTLTLSKQQESSKTTADASSTDLLNLS